MMLKMSIYSLLHMSSETLKQWMQIIVRRAKNAPLQGK